MLLNWLEKMYTEVKSIETKNLMIIFMTIFDYFLGYMYMNIFAFFVIPFLVVLLCGMSKNMTHITFLTKKVITLFSWISISGE